MAALDKSFAWFNDDSHRDASIDILATEMKTNDRDAIAKSYDYLRKIGFFPNDGTVSRKHLNHADGRDGGDRRHRRQSAVRQAGAGGRHESR